MDIPLLLPDFRSHDATFFATFVDFRAAFALDAAMLVMLLDRIIWNPSQLLKNWYRSINIYIYIYIYIYVYACMPHVLTDMSFAHHDAAAAVWPNARRYRAEGAAHSGAVALARALIRAREFD